MTIILGIDPGSRITGYGLIQTLNKKIIFIDSGYIKIGLIQSFPLRLKLIYNKISKIIKKFNPTFFAIEKVFISKNPSSALKLGQAQGAAIVAAVNNNIPVFEYAARKVKFIVVGKGSAKKSQVKDTVCKLLKLVFNKIQNDAADALSIAIAHHYLYKKFL